MRAFQLVSQVKDSVKVFRDRILNWGCSPALSAQNKNAPKALTPGKAFDTNRMNYEWLVGKECIARRRRNGGAGLAPKGQFLRRPG